MQNYLRVGGAGLLGLLVVAVAMTAIGMQADAPPAAETTPSQPKTVTVNVVAYSSWGNQAQGACSPVEVTVGGGTAGKVRVGFFETEVRGAGEMWRSAGWMAAVTAALLTDFDPRAMRVSFEYEGSIDGPSAGAMLTVGILAAIRGDRLRPDAAMTGTINPDGTIGPVGGIVHKIEGAAEAGMKLLLIPEGIRYDTNQRTGEEVELIEFGETKGVEVRPVFDIYSAYEAITDAKLPRTAPGALPRIRQEILREINAKDTVWHNRYASSLDSFTKLPGTAKLSDETVGLFTRGVEMIKRADVMAKQGEVSAAFSDKVLAANFGHIALELGRCKQTYTLRGYAGMVARLRDNHWLQKEIEQTAARLRTETPKTLEQLSVYLKACDAFMEGVSLQLFAKDILAELPQRESEEAMARAGLAATYQIISWLRAKFACDLLDVASSYEGLPIPAKAPWREIQEYLRRAASANLAVFDSLVINPRAKIESVSADAYRVSLMQQDIYYASLMIAHDKMVPRLEAYFGEGEAVGYAYLGASMFIHNRAAGLLAKYYSLDAEVDEDGVIAKVGRERMLRAWLTFAEDQTQRNIAGLQQMGINGIACIQLQEIARVDARRELSDQVEALLSFWSADLHAQVLRRIALGPSDQ